jgi:hypothetical protein
MDMSEFLDAGRMKAASLKVKPERREWEEAAHFFKWTCGEYEHVQQARQHAAFKERLASAQALRFAGNEKLARMDLDGALMKCAWLHARATYCHRCAFVFPRRHGVGPCHGWAWHYVLATSQYMHAPVADILRDARRFWQAQVICAQVECSIARRYANAIAVFVWFQRGKYRSTEDVKLVNTLSKLSCHERAEAAEHLAACFVNSALVLSKQGHHDQVIYACTKALDHQPASAKALLCRAKVRMCSMQFCMRTATESRRIACRTWY